MSKHRHAHRGTTPHGRCVPELPCIEHAANKAVPSCKVRDRRSREDWNWIAPFYENVSSSRGAPMGRDSDYPSEFNLAKPLHIQAIPFVDGDYDPGGAYWGSGLIFCVWDDADHVFYKREGETKVKARFPSAVWIEHEPIRCPCCGSQSVQTNDRLSGDMECYDYIPTGDEEEDDEREYTEERCGHKWNELVRRQRHRGLRTRRKTAK